MKLPDFLQPRSKETSLSLRRFAGLVLAAGIGLGVVTPGAGAQAICSTLYGMTNAVAPASGFYVVNTTTGVAIPVGSKTLASTSAMALDPNTGKVYYFGNTNPVQTWTWDSVTNTNTLLPTNFPNSGLILRAAFTKTGRLFITTNNFSNNIPQLIEIDPATGARISSTPLTLDVGTFAGGSGDMVFDGNNNLFFTAGSTLYSVNITTYKASLVSIAPPPSGSPSLTFVGLAFLADGTLYGTTSVGVIYTINLSTGVTTLVGSAGQNLTDLATCAFPTSQLNSTKTVTKVADSAGVPSSAGPNVIPGDTLEYTITTTNSGTIPAVSTTLTDPIPTGTTYVAGSTKLNTIDVTDSSGGVFPYATAAEIHGVGMNPGVIGSDPANEIATVVFRVTVNAITTGVVSNQGNIIYLNGTPVLTDDPTKPGTTDPTVIPVQPVVTLTKFVRNVTTGTSFVSTSVGAKPKDIIEYCIAYENTGGNAANFVLKDYVPVGMVIVPDAYGTGTGIRWSSTVKTVTGDATAPTGTNLTNVSDSPDQGTFNNTLVTNPADAVGSPQHPGLLTLNLSSTGLPNGGKGTVCFQTQIP